MPENNQVAIKLFYTHRMRPVNNCEDASELKGRWLKEGPRPYMVFDDRRQAVEWWREQGITCLAVADNDY